MPIDPRRIAVAVAGGSAFLHLYSPQAVLPEMAGSFGVGAAEASMVITASTLAVAATAPFTGAIADVVGRKRLIVGALLVLIVPTIMVALSESLPELIFWRFVQGLLFPPIFAVTVAYVGDEWPANEATGVIGLYASASAVGGFLGRFIPGTLSYYIGWRGGLLALTALTALCCLTVLWLLPREKQFVGAGSLGTSLRQMLGHLRNPRLLATYAVGFGVLFNFIATFTYVTFHLAAPPFSRSAAFLGSIFVVYLVGSVFALWTGPLIARIGRRPFILGVLVIWVCGLLLTLVPSIPMIVLGLIVASTCGILTQATSTGFVAITAQEGTSSAVGLYVTAFYTGGTFGGWLAGLAYDAGGWPASVVMVLAMLAVMATIVASAWKQ